VIRASRRNRTTRNSSGPPSGPEYPSAHSYSSTAQTDSIARVLGTNKVTWTLTASRTVIPQLVRTERTYDNLNALMREIYEDVSRFPELFAELIRRGWSDGDLEKLAGGNLLRVLRAAEATANRLAARRPPSTATIELLDAKKAR